MMSEPNKILVPVTDSQKEKTFLTLPPFPWKRDRVSSIVHEWWALANLPSTVRAAMLSPAVKVSIVCVFVCVATSSALFYKSIQAMPRYVPEGKREKDVPVKTFVTQNSVTQSIFFCFRCILHFGGPQTCPLVTKIRGRKNETWCEKPNEKPNEMHARANEKTYCF